MKKSLKLFALLFSSSLVLAGCNDFDPNWPMETPNVEDMVIDTPWAEYVVPCTSISLAKGESNLEINKGETHTFVYTVEPRDATLSNLVWESSNPEVASIDNGVLTALAGGQTTVSVSYGSLSAKSKVNVIVPIQDFEVKNKNLAMDIEDEVQLEIEFTPTDTTQNKIKYELIEGDSVSVSDDGLVKALKKSGAAKIKVTNEVLNKSENVNVNVSDLWNYVDELSVSLKDNTSNKVEVSKSGTLVCDVVGMDSSVPASTLRNNAVSFVEKKANDTDPSYLELNSETGEFTVLEVPANGKVKVEASIVDERCSDDNKLKTKEFTFDVFEVHATGIVFDSHDVIELNNKDADKASKKVSYHYVIEDAYKDTYTVPSRGNPAFSTDDKNVASVDEEGLVSFVGASVDEHGHAKFDTKIRITDPSYKVYDAIKEQYVAISDEISVQNSIYATSISLSGGSTFYLDEETTLTASVTPSVVSENVVWEIEPAANGHEVVEDGNKIKITCKSLTESIKVTAKIGTNLQDSVTLTPTERPVDFENEKVYIVGSANYKTGTSKPVDGGSWNVAKYAFVMTDKTGNPNAVKEYKATIEFAKNDLWKIRENASDWRAVEGWAGPEDAKYQTGRYKTDEGAFLKGQMSVTDDENKNIIVNEAGKYDIYYAFYTNEHPEGWYEVYVEEHGLKLDVNEVHAKLTSPAAATTILASNWDGTLGTKDVDDAYIDVELNGSTGAISITPKALGETTFKVFDDLKEIEVRVLITKESTATKTSYYIRGTAVNGWDEVSEDFVLRESSDDNNIGEILDVYLKDGEFKIAGSDWNNGSWGYWYKNNDEETDHKTVQGGAAEHFSEAGGGNGNIKCNRAGYYNIFLTKNNYIYIEYASTPLLSLELSAEEASIELDETFTVTASGLNGEFQVVGTPTIADVAITGNSALITPKATGTETIKFTDSESGDICDFELTVNAISAKTHKFIQTKSWINNGGEGQHVYVYAFKMGSDPFKVNAPFPGQEATWLRDLDDGMKLFETRFKDIYDTIIVSRVDDNDPNGTRQTDDVAVSVLTDNCIYFDGDSLPDGYLTIGTFPYGTFGLSADEGTITSGHSTTVNFVNRAYEVTYTVSPEDYSAEVTIVGDTATITSSTVGDSTITFTDGTHGNATYDLHVDAPVSTNRQYIETKSFFNNGETEGQKVCVYAWKEGSDPLKQNAPFPGEEATWVKDLEAGKKLFYFDIAETYDYFIVSDVVGDIASGNVVLQTQNVEIAELGGKNCFYMHELDDLDGEGHVKVSPYDYKIELSESSGTIGVGEETNLTISKFLGTPTCTSTDNEHVTVTINATTGYTTISADQVGTYTLTFSDSSTYEVEYELTVQAEATYKTVYLQTKSYFNNGGANEKVMVYCWNGTDTSINNGFPGQQATWVEDDSPSTKIFSFNVNITEYDHIMFVKVDNTTNVYKTVDISLTSEGEYKLGSHNTVWIADYSDGYNMDNPITVGFYTR